MDNRWLYVMVELMCAYCAGAKQSESKYKLTRVEVLQFVRFFNLTRKFLRFSGFFFFFEKNLWTWLYMAVHDCTWLYMTVHGCWPVVHVCLYMTAGCTCLYMTVHVCTLYMAVHVWTWLYMAVHGCIWMYMAVHGCTCLYMDVHGWKWLYMAAHECTWLYMAVHGCTCLYMAVHVWLNMAVHWCTCLFCDHWWSNLIFLWNYVFVYLINVYFCLIHLMHVRSIFFFSKFFKKLIEN